MIYTALVANRNAPPKHAGRSESPSLGLARSLKHSVQRLHPYQKPNSQPRSRSPAEGLFRSDVEKLLADMVDDDMCPSDKITFVQKCSSRLKVETLSRLFQFQRTCQLPQDTETWDGYVRISKGHPRALR